MPEENLKNRNFFNRVGNNTLFRRFDNLYYILIILSWFFLSFTIYLYADINQKRLLGSEDGAFETAGAIFFLLSSIIFFITFIKNKKNIFFILLSVLFLVAFLEEISWGQRIFNVTTPEYIKEINMQGEMNIHNLPIFHGSTKDGTEKSGLQNFITIERLFNIFWFICCFVIPLLYKINNQIKKQLDRVDFPIVPISLGVFFMLNYLITKTIYLSVDNAVRLNEIKECNYAFLFFVVSICFFMNYKK